MFKAISQTIPQDKDFSDRVYFQEIRRRILDGTFYDNLAYEFYNEENNSGNFTRMRDRAPSARYNMCAIVVKDSVQLTFGEGRFPTITSPNKETRDALAKVIANCQLQQTMIHAAITGSVGSVAVLMRVLQNDDGEAHLYFEVLPTQYLTPIFDPKAPDTLIKVVQKYKVRGSDLANAGYSIPSDQLRMDFWFQRVFDQSAEQLFQPMLVSAKDKDGNPKEMLEDADNQVKHNLGFVPIVWIKNLPQFGNSIDGACTFEQAIHTQIEIEYQLSQAGRALKYSADPLLVISDGGNEEMAFKRDASNALTLSSEGKANYVQIDGSASKAVIDYCRTLREMALEAIGGNRTPIDKLSLPQSGKAMEVLYLPLVSLADTLRGSYGENGLKNLLKLVQRAQAKLGNIYAGDYKLPKFSTIDPISLRWTDFFSPTDADRQAQSNTLVPLVGGGLLSRETAVETLAQRYDIEDVSEEVARIIADEKLKQAEQIAFSDATATKSLVPADVTSAPDK